MKEEVELDVRELIKFCRETRSIVYRIIKGYKLEPEHVAEAVELYYDSQKLRLMHANKERTEEPTAMLNWFNFWLGLSEKIIKSKLEEWVGSRACPPEAQWAYEQVGIGPVLAAGLAAHIDVTKARSVSAVWKFAGQAPGSDKRIRGEKLPYNNRLKTLCWKMGESFVKFSGKENATYGRLYVEFKAEELKRNESGFYAAVAARELASKKFRSDTATRKRLEEGKLSDAHLHARAKRRAVKLFLSHYWIKGRQGRGLPIRDPYPIRILGHDGMIEPK